MMKVYLTGNNTANIFIKKYLDCKGNRSKYEKGFRYKAEYLGINWDDCKDYLSKEIDSKYIEIPVNIEPVNFEEIKKSRFINETELTDDEFYSSIKELEVKFSDITYISKI